MFPNTVSPAQAREHAGQYPDAYRYLVEHDFYVPDALRDHGRIRAKKGVAILGLIQKLRSVSACDALVHGELKLSHLDQHHLYSKTTIQLAKDAVENRFRARGITAFIWKLERGRSGGMHAEVVIPADSDLSGLTSYKVIETPEDEEVIAKYLAKPADARACGVRPKDLRVWSIAELERQRLQAIDYLVSSPRKGGTRYHFLHSRGLR